MADLVFFDPYVGSNYGKDGVLFKKKILVLGDSHYCSGKDCTDRESCGDRGKHPKCHVFTQEVVDDYLNVDCTGDEYRWKKTFTTFINSMLGKDTSLAERRAFFDSVVFYNYMQAAAGTSPDVAGDYDHSDKRYLGAFYEVIDKYRPDIVICWGQRLWDTLPNDFNYGEASKGTGIKIGDSVFLNYYDYPCKYGRLMLIGVHHPSAGFDSNFHNEVFKKLVYS